MTAITASFGRAAVLALMALLNAPAGWVPLAQAQEAKISGETIRLARGASAVVSLRENPSTGYQWRVDPERSAGLGTVLGLRESYRPAAAGVPGSPGRHLWHVAGLSAGRGLIALVEIRPGGQAIRRHTVKVVVSPKR